MQCNYKLQNVNDVNTIEARSRLFELIRSKSFSTGSKTLASGRKSSFYFDMKPTMLHPDGISLIAQLVYDRLKNIEVNLVGGLEMGAVPLITPVMIEAAVRGQNISGFIVRKKPKEHGTKKVLEISENPSGKSAVVLDDVTTSGQSAMDAVRAIRDGGAKVTMVLAVVDRGEGAVEYYSEQGIPFASLFTAEEFLRADVVAANIPSNSG